MAGDELQCEQPGRGPTFREALLEGYLGHLREGSSVVDYLLSTAEEGNDPEPTQGCKGWATWAGVLDYASKQRQWLFSARTLDLSAVVDCLEVLTYIYIHTVPSVAIARVLRCVRVYVAG